MDRNFCKLRFIEQVKEYKGLLVGMSATKRSSNVRPPVKERALQTVSKLLYMISFDDNLQIQYRRIRWTGSDVNWAGSIK